MMISKVKKKAFHFKPLYGYESVSDHVQQAVKDLIIIVSG